MKRRIVLGILVLIAFVANTQNAHAQTSGLKVIITRPGEGETLYSSPTAPFARAPVAGWVSSDNFNVTQLQVRLETFQGTKQTGNATTSPSPNGAFSFDMGINPNELSDSANVEKGCAGPCHALTPIVLYTGAIRLRVTVTDPQGKKATAERNIQIDNSGYATMPVQIVVADHPERNVEGLRVVATTRLYDWRAREYSAVTDAAGRAILHAESLAQASTRYLLRVDSGVIGGVLYSTSTPLEITLPPGASTIEPIKLTVASQSGRIEGTGNSNIANSLTVRATQVSNGASYIAKTMQGKFAFSDLPIAKYVLTVDDTATVPQTIDLKTSPVVSTTFQFAAAPARIVRGIVHDSEGNALPLVWLTADEQGKSIRAAPSSGEFVWYGSPGDVHSLWVVAPGYWRRSIALDSDRLDVELTREPETRNVAWGTGAITLPPETLATLTDNHISLRRGWVWGKGTGAFTITTPDVEIELQAGRFALESLLDAPSWLYLVDGQAQVTVLDTNAKITLIAGQMIALGYSVTRPTPVALDSNAVRALHAGEALPVRIETDSSPLARVRDELARVGISLERMLILVGLSLGVTLILWVKRRGVRFR